MKEFTLKHFNSILVNIDDENEYDFESFLEGVNEKHPTIFESGIDEIVNYLTDMIGVESDADIVNMSSSDIRGLCNYINDNIVDDEEYSSY